MKPVLTLTTYSQLKALSDPLRAEMMIRLCERPYTGQLLSEKFGISRAKIHYHLKELEKNGLIEIVYTEEKNGIVQKFYQSVAKGFTPAADLLPHLEILSESGRQIFLQMIERTKSQILAAPEEAFTLQNASEDPAKWNYVSSCWEFDATPEQFQVWVKKFYELMAELNEITKGAHKDPNSKPYYISTTALQIAERTMQQFIKKEEKS
ncbi:TPA: ArsR/SmtB family transcription factor [Bacillus cereus]|uniref:ArsR/SmtB family transcription factor n=1 Tax=Bacillus cereus TaxID=1396 RepID=UPI00062DC26F|nr:winged helix-turn-helix domain-containing protein [Bacillus cereus]MCU4821403.1 winged helix-turn-helix domain-containing protein [Bacillus cereus]MCU4853668.1 winged helix-turn-helix domain-containing protein [Bacillus cereus]MCU4870542.1 winged helix-turn-helix domain-containing protein [Bacillus cereus]MCU4939293.1 winged helix-turn-helix domain-containing protein [Bacillus cereus]MDA2375632.1 winged helix-turn-helix domain-containing protein [Bacillus cereus]